MLPQLLLVTMDFDATSISPVRALWPSHCASPALAVVVVAVDVVFSF